MSKGTLFTGAYSFPHPAEPWKRQFGLVACEAQPDGPGIVTLFLRYSDTGISFSSDGTSLQVKIPEELARVIVPIVIKVLGKLDELRTSP